MSTTATATPPAPTRAGGAELTGPWEQAFWFTVPGQVLSKANHRHGERRGGSSAWTAHASYQQAVNATARQFRPAGWEQGKRAAAVAARPTIVTVILAWTNLDAGNVDKTILDGLQGAVMLSDAQVGWTTSATVRGNAHAGVLVAVARLRPGAGLAERAEAGNALTSQVLAALEGSAPR